MSTAREFRVNEYSATVKGVCILTDVGLLVVELGLPESIDQFLLVCHYILSVSRFIQVFPKILALVLLGVPNARAFLRGRLKELWVQGLKSGIRKLGLSKCLLRFLGELLRCLGRGYIVLRSKVFVLS